MFRSVNILTISFTISFTFLSRRYEIIPSIRLREIGTYAEVAGRSSRINQETLGEERRQETRQDLELREKIRKIISEEMRNVMIDIRNI